jgi:hypothetical protein
MTGDRSGFCWLARSLGEWWDRFAEECSAAVARLLGEADPIHLEAPITGELSDAKLAAAAVRSGFAQPSHSAGIPSF